MAFQNQMVMLERGNFREDRVFGLGIGELGSDYPSFGSDERANVQLF